MWLAGLLTLFFAAGVALAATCMVCNGTGSSGKTCTQCNGKRVVGKSKCMRCGGTGLEKCTSCGGSGRRAASVE